MQIWPCQSPVYTQLPIMAPKTFSFLALISFLLLPLCSSTVKPITVDSGASMTLSDLFFLSLPTWWASFSLLPTNSLLLIAFCNLLSLVTELIASSSVFVPFASYNSISHILLHEDFTWEWDSCFRDGPTKVTAHSFQVEGSTISLGKWTLKLDI